GHLHLSRCRTGERACPIGRRPRRARASGRARGAARARLRSSGRRLARGVRHVAAAGTPAPARRGGRSTMTNLAALVFGAVAALLAAIFSTADSALLASHASETSAPSDAAFAERERRHRALSMARVLAYIAAGASLAEPL